MNRSAWRHLNRDSRVDTAVRLIDSTRILALVLQPHLPFPSLVVCASRSGLMASAPA
jgi:hypothetical protein